MDTSDSYCSGGNEELFAQLAAQHRNEIVISTKFGFVEGGVCGTPQYVAKACEASMKRLNVDVIDLYYQHRVDPDVPIEETIGAMKDLVTAEKVRSLGLSEAAPSTIRRAHAVHPISALQTEYSLWSRFAELEILPVCKELGITYVGYAPMGRGFLSGGLTNINSLAANDGRRNLPRINNADLKQNVLLTDTIKKIAGERKVSIGNIALAWIFASNFDLVPIPGTRNTNHIEDNISALNVILTAKEKKY